MVEATVKEYGIKEIVTFDSQGVSGHPNHISCYNGVKLVYNNVNYTKTIPRHARVHEMLRIEIRVTRDKVQRMSHSS